ncbi:MAG: dephospho-CoA kinase, partial [Solobacterium sp.]|nr:dephospho-CoA kinase [Solobacterium sp.]
VLEGMQKFFTTNSQQPIICAEIPLLFETGWNQYFDRTVVVTCSEDIAIQRMMEERNYTYQEAKARLSMQISAEKQITLADKVIYNEGDLKELDSQINRWLGELRKDIRNGKNAN